MPPKGPMNGQVSRRRELLSQNLKNEYEFARCGGKEAETGKEEHMKRHKSETQHGVTEKMKNVRMVDVDCDKKPDGQTGKLELDHIGLIAGIKEVRNFGVHPNATGEPLRVHQL